MPSLFPVDNLLGAFFLGVIFSAILYGVTCLQVYSYFSRHCEADRPFLKYLVAAIMLFESIQMALLVHSYYVAGVTNFGDFVSDLKAPFSLRIQCPMGIFVAWTIQQFYAWRIYQLSNGQVYIPSFIVVTSAAELAFSIVYVVDSFRHPYYWQVPNQMPEAISIVSLQVVCDLTIATSMVYYLYTRCTRVKQTINMVTTLALYSVTSGALALVISIMNLITYILYPSTLIYVPAFFLLVRVYVCAFMAILNSRDRIRAKLASSCKNGLRITLPKFTAAPNPSRDSTSASTDSVIVDKDHSSADPSSPKNFAQVRSEGTFILDV